MNPAPKTSGRPAGFVMPYRPNNPYVDPTMKGTVRLILNVDAETYAEIDRLAQESNCRVGRMAVTLLEVGLEEFENGGAS